ncbi:Hypothetical predicted protein [Marmota monax]|uniref:Uncharacterized protein n=1 Tax=Marmota monax TaxID=9995 RepID=A0A5E4BXJ2_MARMO|nr:hypothetical protein GHT09_014202 [Marmota monax]VTJ74195.1 Hypothetical predicted protein [Marmota monax]
MPVTSDKSRLDQELKLMGKALLRQLVRIRRLQTQVFKLGLAKSIHHRFLSTKAVLPVCFPSAQHQGPQRVMNFRPFIVRLASQKQWTHMGDGPQARGRGRMPTRARVGSKMEPRKRKIKPASLLLG